MSSIKLTANYKSISDEIRAQMARKKITQVDLSKRIGVCQATIHNRISRAQGTTLFELVLMSKVLGLNITISNGEIIIN